MEILGYNPMPRKSLARKIMSELNPNKIKESKGYYLVVYDFDTSHLKKIPSRFYKNLNEIHSETRDLVLVQKSVIECARFSTVKAIVRLAKHYGAKVNVYRISEKIL